MPVISSTTTAKRISIITNFPQTGYKVTDWRFTHYDTHTLPSVKTQDFRHLISFPQVSRSITHTYTCMSLTMYLSVADNARDAVFLHVSSSSERQE